MAYAKIGWTVVVDFDDDEFDEWDGYVDKWFRLTEFHEADYPDDYLEAQRDAYRIAWEIESRSKAGKAKIRFTQRRYDRPAGEILYRSYTCRLPRNIKSVEVCPRAGMPEGSCEWDNAAQAKARRSSERTQARIARDRAKLEREGFFDGR